MTDEQQSDDTGSAAARATVGMLLREQREAQALSLEDVARETRIPRRHLAAIEADRHADIPAYSYALGFVRSYASYLGLQADAVIAQFKGETVTRIEPVAQMPTYGDTLDSARMPTRAMVMIGLGVVAASALGAWLLFGTRAAEESVAESPAEVSEQAAAEPQYTPEEPDAVATPAADPAAPAADPAMAPAAPPPPAATPPVVAAAPVAVPGAPPVVPGIIIKAVEDSWIKVADGNGRTLRMATLFKGESYAVPDQPGMTLFTGNAGGLLVTVDGRALPPLGAKGVVLRNVRLDRAALQAPPQP